MVAQFSPTDRQENQEPVMQTDPQLEQTIRTLFAEVYTTQNEGAEAPDLDSNSVLLETGLDSLGFAILVTRLEEDLGYDPFSLATEAYYPRTFGEFLSFYKANRPQ
ncbi:MAG: acyl carrier protein [Nitratireductor sp.]